MTPSLRRTALHAWHADAGARLVPFAGFEMPIVYTSILEEHRHVRTQAGAFDVSHMGEIRIRGPQAAAFLQRVFTNRVATLKPGFVRYGLLLAEDGGIIDDTTLYCAAPEDFLLCVNAATAQDDLAWLRDVLARERFDCELLDESEATALIAVQGPRARDLTHRVVPLAGEPPRRWRFVEAEYAGAPVWLSRTGYTGEDGYEIYLPAEHACALWEDLMAQSEGTLRPIGLAARDTLRTEMAYSLYGHEIDRTTNPIEADLERFLAFGTGFIGEKAVTQVQTEGPSRRRVGLVLEGRQVARPEMVIVDTAPIGTVTSGTFSPSIERSIAIGYVPAKYAVPGTQLGVEVRNRRLACEVTETPFYSRKS